MALFPNVLSLNQLPILQEVDSLRAKIEALRPFPADIEQKVLQKLRFDWNYHSNAIEGNSLTYGETITFLMEGLTAKGKPLKDHLDIKGHNKVVNFLLDIVRNQYELIERDIRDLHKEMLVEDYYVDAQTAEGLPTRKLIKVGEYKTEPNHVRTVTGEMFYYARPEEVPARMEALLAWYRTHKEQGSLHPIVLAALFHYEFVLIHPFGDGNGRMSRWLMNLILLQNLYPIAVIRNDKRQEYYAALRQADAGNFTEFVELVAKAVLHSYQIYDKAIKGESIAEPTDLDKEITLLAKELAGTGDKIEMKKSIKTQMYLYKSSLKPLTDELDETTNKFKDLFISVTKFGVVKKMVEVSIDNSYPIFLEDIRKSDWDTIEKKIPYESLGFDNILHYDLGNESIQYINIGFLLHRFRKYSLPFSLNIVLSIGLEEYTYTIFYGIIENEIDSHNFKEYENNRKVIFQKPYHQQLTYTEIQNFCMQVGQEILQHIKDKLQE